MQLGHVLEGIAVTPHKIQAVTTLNQLQAFGLVEPLKADKAVQRDMKNDDTLRGAHELHAQINRRFDKGRIMRAVAYAVYINNVERDRFPGGAPAITLYHGPELTSNDNGFVIPYYGTFLTAIDGETQTQARFILRDGGKFYGQECNAHEETGDWPVAVTMYHGIGAEHAQQILHDYNTYATPVSEKKAATFNTTGAISIAVEKALAAAGIDEMRVNRNSANPRKNDICSYDQVMSMVAGYVLNGQGLNSNATAAVLKMLNTPGGASVDATAIPPFTDTVSKAESNDAVRGSHSSLWQVAGVLMRQGRSSDSLNWEAAHKVWMDTKEPGQGGKRMPAKERLPLIASAF